MSVLPKITPTAAEDRAKAIFDEIQAELGVRPTSLEAQTRRALRDCAEAERARIISALRTPGTSLLAAATKPIGDTIGMGEDEGETCMVVLRAVADWLEKMHPKAT